MPGTGILNSHGQDINPATIEAIATLQAAIAGAGAAAKTLADVVAKLAGGLPAALGGHGGLTVEGVPGGQAVATDAVSSPGNVATHRTNIAAADGTSAPAANDANWLANPGGRSTCLLFVYQTLTGGTNPSTVARPHLRAGGATGQVGGCDAVTILGSVQRVIEVNAMGLDVLCWLESIGGTPASTDVDVYAVWL